MCLAGKSYRAPEERGNARGKQGADKASKMHDVTFTTTPVPLVKFWCDLLGMCVGTLLRSSSRGSRARAALSATGVPARASTRVTNVRLQE